MHEKEITNHFSSPDVFEFYTFDDSEYLLNNARQGDCVDVNGALSLLCIEDNKESTSEFVKKAVDEFIDQILDQIFGGSIGCALFGWIFQQECDGDREDIDPGLLEGRYYDVALVRSSWSASHLSCALKSILTRNFQFQSSPKGNGVW